MGKTIRLTEEQIRRFFGEGFGKRLLGEEGEMLPGQVTYKGNTGKVRNDLSKQKALSGAMSMGGTAYPNFDYVNNKFKDGHENSSIIIKNAIELLKKDINGPINIIDLLLILHEIFNPTPGSEITDEEAKKFLDAIEIDNILSGIIGLNAPDYIYVRLLNLTKEEIERIYTKYGKDFSNWGKMCDGCGGTVWKTNVPTLEHDEAYTLLDFGAAKIDDDSGTFQKGNLEEAKSSAGFGQKAVSFSDILEIHHINGNPNYNSPFNLVCLCPNCHTCIDSTSKTKDLNFSVNELIKNNAIIKEGSIIGSMPEKTRKYYEEKIKRLSLGYYSDMTIANDVVFGGASRLETEVEELVNHMRIPNYVRNVINDDVLKESIKKVIANAENFATSWYNYLSGENKNEFSGYLSEDTVAQKPKSKITNYLINDYNFDYLLYDLFYQQNQALLNVYINNKAVSDKEKTLKNEPYIVINQLGVKNNEQEFLNTIKKIIYTCQDIFNELVPKIKRKLTDLDVSAGFEKNFVANEPRLVNDPQNPENNGNITTRSDEQQKIDDMHRNLLNKKFLIDNADIIKNVLNSQGKSKIPTKGPERKEFIQKLISALNS